MSSPVDSRIGEMEAGSSYGTGSPMQATTSAAQSSALTSSNSVEVDLLSTSDSPQHFNDVQTVVETPVGRSRAEVLDSIGCPQSNVSTSRPIVKQGDMLRWSDTMDVSVRSKADILFARAIYATAIPFRKFDAPEWKTFFSFIRPVWAANKPSAYKLSHSLLDSEYAAVQADHKIKLEKSAVKVIACDGWSDVQQWSRIQYFMLGGLHRPIFLKSDLPMEKRHTGELIAASLEQVMTNKDIYGLTPSCMDGVIMDNAKACEKAGKLLMAKFPHLTAYGCGAHAVNLLAADFCRLEYFAEVLQSSQQIAKNFKYKNLSKAVLYRLTTKDCTRPLNTLLWVKTRWSSAYKVVKRLLLIQPSLMKAVLDPSIEKEIQEAVGKGVRRSILDDVFWSRVRDVASILRPVAHSISEIEGDNVPAAVMPRVWRYIRHHISAATDASEELRAHQDELLANVANRRAFCCQRVHMAGNILHPCLRGGDITDD